MKKIYQLSDPKKHADRVLESIKSDIRKYMKREKKKPLAEKKTHYWDFDCKVGATQATAKTTTAEEIIKAIDTIKDQGASEIYVEILVKMVEKPLKEEESSEDETEN